SAARGCRARRRGGSFGSNRGRRARHDGETNAGRGGAAGMLGPVMTPTGQTGAPLLPVEPVAVELGERFAHAGHQLHLVGGSVRDLLMGRPFGGELDFATDAHPEATIRLLQGWAKGIVLKGIRFGTVGAKKDGVILEVTTFRKEIYPDDDRHPNVTFADDVHVDLSRR